jgi:DNA gyrase subunit A
MKNYKVTDKTGEVAAVKMLREGDDLLVISDDGTIIRMAGEGVSRLGRATQGVRLMRLMEGSRVIDVEKTEREVEEEKEDEPATAEATETTEE